MTWYCMARIKPSIVSFSYILYCIYYIAYTILHTQYCMHGTARIQPAIVSPSPKDSTHTWAYLTQTKLLLSFLFLFIVTSICTAEKYHLCIPCSQIPEMPSVPPCLVHPGVIKLSGCTSWKAKKRQWPPPIMVGTMVSLQPEFFVYDRGGMLG